MTVFCLAIYVYFLFFKQKTAYDMRISDWSSDVCSSDLPIIVTLLLSKVRLIAFPGLSPERKRRVTMIGLPHAACTIWRRRSINLVPKGSQIGRASCRERVCQYV